MNHPEYDTKTAAPHGQSAREIEANDPRTRTQLRCRNCNAPIHRATSEELIETYGTSGVPSQYQLKHDDGYWTCMGTATFAEAEITLMWLSLFSIFMIFAAFTLPFVVIIGTHNKGEKREKTERD